MIFPLAAGEECVREGVRACERVSVCVDVWVCACGSA